MINHTESFSPARQLYDHGFPTDTKGVYEITFNGKVHQATITDSFDPDAPGLCWQLINGGGTVRSEFVSSSRKIG